MFGKRKLVKLLKNWKQMITNVNKTKTTISKARYFCTFLPFHICPLLCLATASSRLAYCKDKKQGADLTEVDTKCNDGAYSVQWELLSWCTWPKCFLASGLISCLCGPLNGRNVSSSPAPTHKSAPAKFYKYQNSMDQKFLLERVTVDLCRSGCPGNSFTDISFIMVVYGEMLFGMQGNY